MLWNVCVMHRLWMSPGTLQTLTRKNTPTTLGGKTSENRLVSLGRNYFQVYIELYVKKEKNIEPRSRGENPVTFCPRIALKSVANKNLSLIARWIMNFLELLALTCIYRFHRLKVTLKFRLFYHNSPPTI